MSRAAPALPGSCLGEAFGTFILIFFGCGVVHAAVLTGAQQGLWQVAIVWGVAVTVAIYVVAGLSGAHINPAMTVALVVCRGFSPRVALVYIGCQVLGAFLAAAALFVIFQPFLKEKEDSLGVQRGDPGSVLTAMCYGEYYPNPGLAEAKFQAASGSQDVLDAHFAKVPMTSAFFAEVLGTLLLALVVMAVTDERNGAAPAARLGPVFIGLTVALLISVLAPVTQACFNPARDFGPRLFAFWAGWGDTALPGPNGDGFWLVYIVAPILGAVLGGGLYCIVLRPFQAAPVPEGEFS